MLSQVMQKSQSGDHWMETKDACVGKGICVNDNVESILTADIFGNYNFRNRCLLMNSRIW